MMLNPRLQLLIIALWAVVACKGTGQTPGPFQDLNFDVDSTRIGDTLTMSGIQVRLPIWMIAAPTDAMATIQDAAARDTTEYALTPECVFYDTIGAVLVFSHFQRHEHKPADFIAFARSYAEKLRSKEPPAPQIGDLGEKGELPSQEWLTLGGVPAVQYYTSDSTRIQFAYVVDTDRPLHIAISVPRAVWPEEVHNVESMLGTVKKVSK